MNKEEKHIENKMLTGTTASGFKYEINPEAANDYELLEVLMEVDNGDTLKIVTAVDMMLGKEQTKELKEHVRKVSGNGRVKLDLMMHEFYEILQNHQQTKN